LRASDAHKNGSHSFVGIRVPTVGRSVREGLQRCENWPRNAPQPEMCEFLLVPYWGACIHVPPPPANEIVHAVLPEGETYRGGAFDALWVSGVLKVERSSSDVAEDENGADLFDAQDRKSCG
jgi:hypothetical protein